MDISVLKGLTELFAIIAHIEKEAHASVDTEFVNSYFIEQFGAKHANTYINQFNEYLKKYEIAVDNRRNKQDSRLFVKLLNICNKLNAELSKKQKIQILIQLLLFVKSGQISNSIKLESLNLIDESIKTISETLMIDEQDYFNCKYFISDRLSDIADKQNLLAISNNTEQKAHASKFLLNESINGTIIFLHIKCVNIFLCNYNGNLILEINNKECIPGNIYNFDYGSYITGNSVRTIYYTDVLNESIKADFNEKIQYCALDIEYAFPGTDNGVHKVNLFFESGELIAIMGPSGAGKSTLLSLLIGKLPLQKGSILINGNDLSKDSDLLKGIIGYVPQDDLLIDELTVYQNLYYNSKLYLGNVTEEKIKELVDNTLVKLDLFKIKDLKAGSPVEKYISGGERKRLNIAMELIREPSILFLDEPTSGLSSSDSKTVVQILKNQTLEGKLIILNIHQPSSEVFKLFSKLLILDKGGYSIFYGNPIESLSYFKKKTSFIHSFEAECPICGNVNPEEIFQIVEEKDVNEFGELTEHRKVSPVEWYDEFNKEYTFQNQTLSIIQPFSDSKYKNASPLAQFKTFILRNILSKAKDSYYLLMTFLVPPLLAVILGYFTKYISNITDNPHTYYLFYNENLPAYLFMCVLVALFLGLIISAEEIIRDKRIIEKEKFLNLSKFSYYNSKIIVLLVVSVVQLLEFIVFGNSILKINGLNFSYLAILFAAIAFGNILGLILSSTIKSVVAIYIVIPLILIPQILLSGVIVKYDKLYEPFVSKKYVPFFGDIMVSRWAFEALTVNQYKNNSYTKHFFDIEKQESNLSFNAYYLITELNTLSDECKSLLNDSTEKPKLIVKNNLIKNEIKKMIDNYQLDPIQFDFSKPINSSYLHGIDSTLTIIKQQLFKKIDILLSEKDSIIAGIPYSVMLENNNEALNNVVLNKTELNKIVRDDAEIIRKSEPIYQIPDSKCGRAQFYSSEKRIGNFVLDTVLFNILLIWLVNIVLYMILVFELPALLSKWFNQLKKFKYFFR